MSLGGTFVSVAEARAIIDAIERRGAHSMLEIADGHWYWKDPAPNGRGPFLSFCEAVYGLTPPDMEWVCTCEAQDRGCVRPSHYTLIRRGERPPLHPAVVSEFALRITQEAMARRDRSAFARELGVSRNTLDTWIRGESHPGRDIEDRLAKRFGWGQGPRRWLVTVIYQSVEIADSAGAAANAALAPLERPEGFPLKAVIHSVAKIA